jgi:hypothetical protein
MIWPHSRFSITMITMWDRRGTRGRAMIAASAWRDATTAGCSYWRSVMQADGRVPMTLEREHDDPGRESRN